MKDDLISFFNAVTKESNIRRETISPRIFCNVSSICEFGTVPSSDCGLSHYSFAKHAGRKSPVSSRARISVRMSFKSLTFLSADGAFFPIAKKYR